MGTYAAMQSRIADEINRTDLTSQIALAILSAITYYERRGWYFTSSRTLTFPTVLAKEFYTVTDNADIPNLINIDSARITISTTEFVRLERVPYTYLEEVNLGGTAFTGVPAQFAYYAQQIRLYPVPDAVYTITVSGVFPLTALSGSTDTNVWTTQMEDLIRYRAKWDIYSNLIGNLELAGVMAANEGQALQSLIGVTASREASGLLIATVF